MSEWEEFAAYRNMIREAKAEAWEEGLMSIKPHLSVWPKQHHLPDNPYRQEESSENLNSQPAAETPNCLNLEGEE